MRLRRQAGSSDPMTHPGGIDLDWRSHRVQIRRQRTACLARWSRFAFRWLLPARGMIVPDWPAM